MNRPQLSPGEIYDQGEEWKARAIELIDDARFRLAKGNSHLGELLVQKPLQAIALAFGTGVALGWLIKRR